MKNLFTRILAMLALGLPAAAQTTAPPADSVRYWATHLRAGLNANEVLISKNWKSGGTSSLGISLLFNGTARYERGRHNWHGEANFLYAGQYTQGEEGSYRKTNNRLYLDTKYGYDLTQKWGLFTALNLLSQFAPGYNYGDDGHATLISDFLAPGYLTGSFGA